MNLLNVGDAFYRVWIVQDEETNLEKVIGDAYRILAIDNGVYSVLNRQGNIEKFSITDTSLIKLKEDSISEFRRLEDLVEYRNQMKIKKQKYKPVKKVKMNDRVVLLYNDVEIKELSIVPYSVEYKPVWTGNPYKRLDSVRSTVSVADYTKGEISGDSPIAKAILNAVEGEVLFYKTDDGRSHKVEILEIFKKN